MTLYRKTGMTIIAGTYEESTKVDNMIATFWVLNKMCLN